MSSAPCSVHQVTVSVLAAAGLAVACSSAESIDPAVDATWVSGARLKMVFDDGGDGAIAFVGIVDTSTGDACEYALASDGVLRCLPLVESTVAYADAGCTAPVVLHSSERPCDRSPFALSDDPAQGCVEAGIPPRRRRVFEANGSPPLTGATTFYRLEAGACLAQEPTGATDILLPAREVAPATFVAAVTHTVPGGDDLGLVVASGEDGSRSLVGLVDTAREGPCVPADELGYGAPISVDACVPSSAQLTSRLLFADPGCTERVAPVSPECEPNAILATEDPGCDSPYALFAPAARGELSTFYVADEGGCVAETTTESFLVRGLGARLTSSSFPQFGARFLGSGRLRARYRTALNGRQVESQDFIDLDLGRAPCAPRRFSDGTVRCVPSLVDLTYADSTIFLDPECERRALRVVSWETCPAPPASFGAVYEPTACGPPPIVEVRALGEPVSPTELFALDAASFCVPISVTQGDLYREVGPVLDRRVFAGVAQPR